MAIKSPKDYGIISSNLKEDAHGSIKVASPFDLQAEDFLKFAEADIKGNKKKDIVNALSNSKRAIENRIDLLLYAFGYPSLKNSGLFQQKQRR